MTNAIMNEIKRIEALPQIKAQRKATPEDMLKALKVLRALKKATEGSTKKATQIKLEGKRVCELFESAKNAYLWVRKDVYNSAGLKATKDLKLSGNIEFYIAKYTTKEECFADYAKLQEYCNL